MPGSKTHAIILPALVLLSACGGSSESTARKSEQEIASWEATTELTAELSKRGALPAEYIRQVSAAAAQGLEQARRRVQSR